MGRFARGPLPPHDFGSMGLLQRAAVARGLRQVAAMVHLGQHQRYVQQFEGEFAARLGAAHALGVASGTDALFLALLQAGAGPGTEVITVANTWITTVTPIHQLGATPVFVDIDPATGMMDLAHVARAITPATVALLPVHMYGNMVPMGPLMELARRHRLAVIEDSCQAIGASYQGRAAGSWGDAGCFSFFTTKLVGAPGDGGMLLTPHADWHAGLRRHAIADWDTALTAVQARVPSRLTPLSVPFLRARLRALAPRIAARRQQWQRYRDGLRGLPQLSVLEPAAGVSSSYRNCMLVTPQQQAVLQACKQRGLPVEEMYPPSRRFAAQLAAGGSPLPHTQYLLAHSLSLPLGVQMGKRDIDRLIDLIRRCH